MILSKCFPSRRTAGYSHMADRQVVSVNGHRVVNLQQMYSLVQKLHESAEFLAFELFCVGGNAIVTTSTAVAEKTRTDTLRQYRIPTAASPELEDAHAAHLAAGGEEAEEEAVEVVAASGASSSSA